MTTEVEKKLSNYFRTDATWCSDFTSKEHLMLAALGEDGYQRLVERFPAALDIDQLTTAGSDRFDTLMKGWLVHLPDIIRYVVERRSGLWTGNGLPWDWDTIGEELGLSSTFIEACYREGLSLIRKQVESTLAQR